MITAIHILGQILLGGFFIYNGVKHITSHKDYTSYAESMKVPFAGIAVGVTGVLLILGGVGILLNIYVNVAILLLVLFLVPTSIMMHAFWELENPGEKSAQKIQFLKNMAILGAVLLLYR